VEMEKEKRSNVSKNRKLEKEKEKGCSDPNN